MRRKLVVVYMGLTMGLILTACSAKSETPSQSEEIVQDKEPVADVTAVSVQDMVFEGCYFDEGIYKYYDMPQSESPFIYCEITVSNVTPTSFDFVISEKVMATEETQELVPLGTAVFIEDGTRAAYYGEDLTLYFSFPDEKDIYPKHIKVEGLDKLEGNSYINNNIPGHESG